MEWENYFYDAAEVWEDEGGNPLPSCLVCGKIVRLHKDGLCAVCWLKEAQENEVNNT